MTEQTEQTEPITDTMILALQQEAANHGDVKAVVDCDRAIRGSKAARRRVAGWITEARGMDDSKPFVRVVAE